MFSATFSHQTRHKDTTIQCRTEMHRNQSKCSSSSEIKLVNLVQKPSAPSEYTLTKSLPSENYRNFEFNGKLYSSVWPEKIDLLSEKEQEELKDVPWFQAGLPREISLDILLQQQPGSFLVRQSESHMKCFALSVRVAPVEPPKLSHYLIEKSQGMYRIKGFTKEFSSLKSLVVHHSVLKEQLPIPLILPRLPDMIQAFIVDEASQSESEDVKSPPTTLCFRRKSKEK